MATEQDHTWGILDDMLVFLAGKGVPTPERSYKFDGGWTLAMSDLRRYTSTLTAERDQLRAENAALSKVNQSHADYYEIREERDQLRNTVAGLRRALEEALKDGERLDWLHENMAHVTEWTAGQFCVQSRHTGRWFDGAACPTPRAAIDAARGEK